MVTKKKVNVYSSLQKFQPHPEQRFVVLAYFLLNPPVKEYGCYIFLRAFGREEEAREYRDTIMNKTGLKNIILTLACNWRYFGPEVEPDQVNYVPLGMDRNLAQKHQEDIKDQEIKEEIAQDQIAMSDPTSIMYYANNWKRLIETKKEADSLKKKYEDEIMKYNYILSLIQTQKQNQPDIEDYWIEHIESKLISRGEHETFNYIVEGYRELKDEIFPSYETLIDLSPAASPEVLSSEVLHTQEKGEIKERESKIDEFEEFVEKEEEKEEFKEKEKEEFKEKEKEEEKEEKKEEEKEDGEESEISDEEYSSTEVQFEFSEPLLPVNLPKIDFDPRLEISSDSEGSEVSFDFKN